MRFQRNTVYVLLFFLATIMLVCMYCLRTPVIYFEPFYAEDCVKKDTLAKFNQQAKRMIAIMQTICAKIPLPLTSAEKKKQIEKEKQKGIAKGKKKAGDSGLDTDKMSKIEMFQSSPCVDTKDIQQFQAMTNQLNLTYETMFKSVNGAIDQRIKNVQAKKKADEGKAEQKKKNAAANKKYTQQGYKTGAEYGFSQGDMHNMRNQLQGTVTKGKKVPS